MTDPDLPDLTGGPDADAGGFDMGALLEQAMEMQQQLLEAQAEAAETVVEGQAGGGAVTVRVTGAMEFESVTISPAAVDAGDLELLGDLVLAALRDAMEQIGRLQQASMGGLDLAGLGGMGDMLGLGGEIVDAEEIEVIEIVDAEEIEVVDGDDADGSGDAGRS